MEKHSVKFLVVHILLLNIFISNFLLMKIHLIEFPILEEEKRSVSYEMEIISFHLLKFCKLH